MDQSMQGCSRPMRQHTEVSCCFLALTTAVGDPEASPRPESRMKVMPLGVQSQGNTPVRQDGGTRCRASPAGLALTLQNPHPTPDTSLRSVRHTRPCLVLPCRFISTSERFFKSLVPRPNY